jgi:chemotaxis protein methyltransferase CheR
MNDLAAPITGQEFALFQRLIYRLAGISLSDAKRVLLVGRLGRRLKHYGFDTYTQYYRLLASGEHPDEVQQMIDLLTTNETYFFREPQHFDFLRDVAIKERRGPGTFRIWSGASSSGEEAYSMAMVLAEHRSDGPWEVFGSDISMTVLARARAGHLHAGADFRNPAGLPAQVLPQGRALARRQAPDRQRAQAAGQLRTGQPDLADHRRRAV